MPSESGAHVTIGSPRLLLRPFTAMDKEPFFALNTHPDVVATLGSTPSRAESDDLADFVNEEIGREGFGFWAVEVTGGPAFVGMVGLHRVGADLPPGPAVEVGWRLHPDHWGRGYATEAAATALRHGFDECGLDEIIAFTAVRNVRSQAVMRRLGMVRDEGGDFVYPRLPEGSPLRPHVLYRVTPSQLAPTVAS